MGKHGTVSLHGEECDITSRSRVDRDGGKTHMCQKDLEQSTPCGRGIFKESSLVKTKTCMCCPWGVLARMDSEQISVDSCSGVEWLFSLFTCNMFLLEGCTPDEKGQGMLRAA